MTLRKVAKSLDNCITKGTSVIQQGNTRDNAVLVPTNEDWCMVCEVISSEGGLVKVKKIWDESDPPTEFYCKLVYEGDLDRDPPQDYYKQGNIIKVHRVGEFNSQGLENPELRQESQDGYSFLVFIPQGLKLIFIEDIDGATGREITFDSGGSKVIPPNSATLPLEPLDPLNQFHNNTPPFQAGRVYVGVKAIDRYIVVLQGFGEATNNLTATAGGITFSLETDSAGQVVNFSATT